MHWLPLVPFAGEEQLRPLLEGQNSSEAWVLLLSSIVKLLMLGLCLETGWRGGVFFPLFLVACALGMGLHLLLPDLGGEDEPTGEEMAAALAFQIKRLEAMQEAGHQLMARPRLGQDFFARGAPEKHPIETEHILEVTLFELLQAYARQRRRGAFNHHCRGW